MQIFIEMVEIPAHPEATALFQDTITNYDNRFLVINKAETFFNRILIVDLVVVLWSFSKIQELKLAMNLIYDRNQRPSSVEYHKGIFTRVLSRATCKARNRVKYARNRMTVA
jgi:hypothetical protein